MQRRILSLAITGAFLFAVINWNCSKLDTTNIGSDLLPAVDNVTTFDTLLTINTTQGIFNDTTRMSRGNDHALGVISNDPIFGTTNADIFLQLKPPFYPYYFGNAKDTLGLINGVNYGAGLDSIVLCLSYKGFWGDTNQLVHLDVREVADVSPFNFRDSVYLSKTLNYSPPVAGTILGSTNVDARTLRNYTKYANGRDSANNQIRIKLSPSWAATLFGRDSIKANGLNNAYYNDSVYRRFYNGLAVIATTGNGLLYINLADTATKLEVHFRRRNVTLDSVYYSFKLNSNDFGNGVNPPSATANHIVRNRPGTIASPASTDLYLQTTSGTYVNLSIPALSTLSNRIIHRAEIIIEQIPGNTVTDGYFSAPNFLYLDLKDTTVTANWKPIYLDLSPNYLYDPDYRNGVPYFPTNGVDYQYFGGYRRDKTDALGTRKYYNFNISRYVQQLVTKHTPNYNMRLYAPFNLLYSQYSTSYIPYSNNIAYGRVKVGSGTNPNYKLRLRIVYSKL